MPKVSVGRAELDTRLYVLYRFYDRTGVLLYVGITVDFKQRCGQHAKYKDWWAQVDHTATKIEPFYGQRAVLAAEREAIQTEKPLENERHNQWVDVDEEPGCECGGDDLPAVVHDELTPYEREEIFAAVRAMPADERVYEQEPVEFVRVAFQSVMETRSTLDAAILGFQMDLPPELLARCSEAAINEVQHHMGDDYTDYDVTANVLRHLGAKIGRLLRVSA